MKYNFDAVIDRRGSDAIKLVDVPEIWGKDDLLPCGLRTWTLQHRLIS